MRNKLADIYGVNNIDCDDIIQHNTYTVIRLQKSRVFQSDGAGARGDGKSAT